MNKVDFFVHCRARKKKINVSIEKLRLIFFEKNGKLRLNLKIFIHYLRIKLYS
jgi:hypothetical protein